MFLYVPRKRNRWLVHYSFKHRKPKKKNYLLAIFHEKFKVSPAENMSPSFKHEGDIPCNNHQWSISLVMFSPQGKSHGWNGGDVFSWHRAVVFRNGTPLKKADWETAPELGSVPMFLTKFAQSSLIYIGFALWWRSKIDMKCVRDLALMQLVEFGSLKLIEIYHASLLFWCMSVCVRSLWTGVWNFCIHHERREREREKDNKRKIMNKICIYIYIHLHIHSD